MLSFKGDKWLKMDKWSKIDKRLKRDKICLDFFHLNPVLYKEIKIMVG
jgi:hypothetical protein